MPRKPQRQFQIGLNIDTMLQRSIKVPDPEFSTASLTKAYGEFSNAGTSDEEDSWSSDSDYFDSSDSEGDDEIDEADFLVELQSWMQKLTVNQSVPRRSNSMPLLGAKNSMPKYKEQISHHPIVANRMRKCAAEFMQSVDEVTEARKAKEDPQTDKPEDCVRRILATVGVEDMTLFSPSDSAFLDVTEERVSAHAKDLTDACRSVNMKLLRKYLKEGRNFQACNRYGESLVHIMSRRGSLEGLSFLIEQGGASLMVRDDFGRNPLHDAMWTNKPSFEMVSFILNNEPALLFAKDSRGATSLAYIPRSRWAEWSNYLALNKGLILSAVL